MQRHFLWELLALGLGFGGLKIEDPRTVLLLITGVAFTVVRGALLPHGPEDLKPSLAQAAQSGSMGGPASPMGLVVGLSPGAIFSAAIGPQMHGETQMFVTVPAHINLAHLPGLEADGGSPRHAL